MGMEDKDTLCGCGCGAQTNVDAQGVPRRFLQGHNRRCVDSKGWIEQGHWFISVDGKKRALHRVIAEKREGRVLGRNEVVHHIDFDPFNNAPENLVILPRREHTRLHMRGQKRRWTGEEKARALVLYQSGMSADEVA